MLAAWLAGWSFFTHRYSHRAGIGTGIVGWQDSCDALGQPPVMDAKKRSVGVGQAGVG